MSGAVAEQFGIFSFFAGWVLLMTLFIILFVPETKNIPLVRAPLCTFSVAVPGYQDVWGHGYGTAVPNIL